MMDKSAQKRSVLNKLREMTDVSGMAAEKLFNPEFQRVMESLRAKDADIRSIATGKSVEGGNPGSDEISLKELLKSAKSNLNRREYMSAVVDLGRFHYKMAAIVEVIQALDLDVSKVHHEFLFKDLDEEKKKHLLNLQKRFATQQDQLKKQAGVLDFLTNIGTSRGRALAAWEKRYPKEMAQLKKQTTSILEVSQRNFNNLIGMLKEMASARSTRNPDAYMKAANRVVSLYNSYDNAFKTYYQDNVKNFLEKVKLEVPEKVPATKVEQPQEIAKQEVKPADNQTNEEVMSVQPEELVPFSTTRPAPPPIPHATEPSPLPPVAQSPEMDPSSFKSDQIYQQIRQQNPELQQNLPSVPLSPQPAPQATPISPLAQSETPTQAPTQAPATQKEERKTLPYTFTHQKFYHQLETLANENPIIVSKFISKYASSIQSYDFETSIKLMKIAKSLIQES